VDLRGAYLEGADLRNVHLEQADLHGAHQEEARPGALIWRKRTCMTRTWREQWLTSILPGRRRSIGAQPESS
jgi:uncharacterized protein YjbI with pentapeptide repeats